MPPSSLRSLGGYKVYQTQKLEKTKGDWYLMIQEEKTKFDIQLSDEEISCMTKYRFKSFVEKKINHFAFEYLKDKAARHSKSFGVLKEVKLMKKMKRQSYLRENTFTKSESLLLFELRSRMLDVKSNFSTLYNNNLVCRSCKLENSVENEEHLLHCDALKSEIEEDHEVNFDFVYKNLEHQRKAVYAYKAVLRKREVLLKYQENL
jgi:hypothetical protein